MAGLGRGAALGVASLVALGASWATIGSFIATPAGAHNSRDLAMSSTATSQTGPVDAAGVALAQAYGLPGWTPLVVADGDPETSTQAAARAARAARSSQRAARAAQRYSRTYGPDASTAARVTPPAQVAATCRPGAAPPETRATEIGHPDYDPMVIFGADALRSGVCGLVEFVSRHGTDGATPGRRDSDLRDGLTVALRDEWALSQEGGQARSRHQWITGLTGANLSVRLVTDETLRIAAPALSAVAINTRITDTRVSLTRVSRAPAPGAAPVQPLAPTGTPLLAEPRLVVSMTQAGTLLMTRNPDRDPAAEGGDLWKVPFTKTYTFILVPDSARRGWGWRTDEALGAWTRLDLDAAKPVAVPTTQPSTVPSTVPTGVAADGLD